MTEFLFFSFNTKNAYSSFSLTSISWNLDRHDISSRPLPVFSTVNLKFAGTSCWSCVWFAKHLRLIYVGVCCRCHRSYVLWIGLQCFSTLNKATGRNPDTIGFTTHLWGKFEIEEKKVWHFSSWTDINLRLFLLFTNGKNEKLKKMHFRSLVHFSFFFFSDVLVKYETGVLILTLRHNIYIYIYIYIYTRLIFKKDLFLEKAE